METFYRMALGMVPGIGNKLFKSLISYCESAEQVFKAPHSFLKKVPGVGERLVAEIAKKATFALAEKELEKAAKLNIQLLFYMDEQYPFRLKQIYDAPSLLYFKGKTDLNTIKTIGIVGTRQASGYGFQMTNELVRELRRYSNILMVSGLAYGIDIHAHKACLDYQIPTVGVMANGVDSVYPYVHKEIAQRMLETGGLLSENRIGSLPDAPKFPERNRVIAGMCDAIIVVEAAKKGGALITAELANSYNREVFAVPGNLTQPYSLGCNYLIKTHKAHLIQSVDDLDYIMNWDLDAKPPELLVPVHLSEKEKTIIQCLKEKELLIDELSFKTQIPMNKLASLLLTMEFEGYVQALPGKKFALGKKLQ
ncbi:DNA-processing protein DprA [Rapidithrix thailandica]|uniref:DNA-processing protein DprA n=1 Tax=Rapidithrix thailandica TaxID=413964 RepID=A0AAW9SD80_9BACT